MSRTLHPSTIVPPGFRVESAGDDGAVTIVTVRHTGKSILVLVARRTPSGSIAAIPDGLRIAAGRTTSPPNRRRTAFPMRRAILSARNLHGTLSKDVLAPGRGEPRAWRASSIASDLPSAGPGREFARRLMVPVSNDTLLRVVRRRGCPTFPAPTVVGWTIGRGNATSATARSFAISNGGDQYASCGS